MMTVLCLHFKNRRTMKKAQIIIDEWPKGAQNALKVGKYVPKLRLLGESFS